MATLSAEPRRVHQDLLADCCPCEGLKRLSLWGPVCIAVSIWHITKGIDHVNQDM